MRDWKSEVRARLTTVDLSPERTAEIVEELAQHLRDRGDELRSHGMTESAAEEAIVAELNDGSLARELSRIEGRNTPPLALGQESSRRGLLASVWQDIRYGVRVLRLNPSFTVSAPSGPTSPSVR